MRQFRSLIVLASIALAACAIAAVPARPPEALRGCWIERRGAETVTMRWFPQESPISWRGDLLNYPAGGGEPLPQTFMLGATAGEREQFGWAVCEQGEPHGPPCRRAVFGAGHSLGEGDDWMELHASADHLRFLYRTGPDTLVLFDGARDGCD